MHIRTLVEDDAAAWWELRRESLETDPLAFGRAVEEHRETTVASAKDRFRGVPEGSFHLGAFGNESLIGLATFMRETGLKEMHKGHIYGVYVSPAQRRTGVARALLSELLRRVRLDSRVETVLLNVALQQVAARELYASFGFEVYGTEPHALKVGDIYVDENLMLLRLAR